MRITLPRRAARRPTRRELQQQLADLRRDFDGMLMADAIMRRAAMPPGLRDRYQPSRTASPASPRPALTAPARERAPYLQVVREPVA